MGLTKKVNDYIGNIPSNIAAVSGGALPSGDMYKKQVAATKKLAGFRDNLALNDLTESVNFALLEKIRYKDENGVWRYKAKDHTEEEIQSISDTTFSQFGYHLTKRHLERDGKPLTTKTANVLDDIIDPDTGKSINDTAIIPHYFRITSDVWKSQIKNMSEQGVLSTQALGQIMQGTEEKPGPVQHYASTRFQTTLGTIASDIADSDKDKETTIDYINKVSKQFEYGVDFEVEKGVKDQEKILGAFHKLAERLMKEKDEKKKE